MASESKSTKTEETDEAGQDWQKKEGFGRFIRDILIAAAVLGGGLFLYRGRVENGKQVRELGAQAKALMLKDSPKPYAQAEEKLQKVVALDGQYGFGVATLAELYAIRWSDLGMDDQAGKAKEWTAKADALDAKINERYGADILAKLGERDYAGAEALAADISKRAASSHVVNGYGRALRGLGKIEEARIALKKSADMEWRNPRFACDFADIYFDDGDFLNAENFYTKGVESNSEHPRSLIGVARARIARGIKLKDASESLTEILARPAELLSPKLRSNALTAVAELRLFEKKFDEAQKSADEAIAAYANNPWAHFVKGRALAGAKNTAAAASIEKAIEMDKFVPEFYYLGSAALIEGGDSAKAQALLDAYAKVLKPDDRYYIAYGELLAKLGKPDEALAQFNKAIEANNFNANAHYAKGALLLESKKDYEGAQKELEAALGANEIFPDAHARLGDLRFAKKEYQEGCEQYAQGLAKMKILQVPRERLNDLREGVEKKLVAANKKDMAKMWMTETGALIR